MKDERVGRMVLPMFAWAVFVVLYFAPVIPRDKVLAPLDILETLEAPWAASGPIAVHNTFCYDAISQYIPYEFAVHQSLRDSGSIGWNPMTHGGTALAENHMLCPGSLRYVFHRFLPFWDAWDTGRMMHYFLAGIGMILLLLESGRSAMASVLGALTFAFSSQMVVWIHSDVIASGCCWTPWMLWAFMRLYRVMTTVETVSGVRRFAKRTGAVLVAGLLVGQSLRGGFLHTTLFNLSALFLFFFVGFLETRWTPRNSSSSPATSRLVLGAAGMAIALAFAISLPWFRSVVPPALHGGHSLRSYTIGQCFQKLPTLITVWFPMALGSPQGIDAFKAFGSDFTEIKFAGGTAFVLALLAFFTRKAPLLPKVLFATFLVIPFTPLSKWFYHRCFVISALGLGWLAAWQMDELSHNSFSRKYGRYLLVLFTFMCVGWFVASIVMTHLETTALPAIQSYVSNHLPSDRVNRAAWMAERAERFWRESKIWSPLTLAEVFFLGVGLYAAFRLRPSTRTRGILCGIVILSTFGEMTLFGRRIWYAAERPMETRDSPYPARAWVKRFTSHLGNGSVFFWQPVAKYRFDYMQINTPSACGIRQAEGYESVQPTYLVPTNRLEFNPTDFGRAGISHISTPHGEPFPNHTTWQLVEESPDYDLYSNPHFRSIFLAKLADGSEIPLFAEDPTSNAFHLVVPVGTKAIRFAMSYHHAWRYRLDNDEWIPLSPSFDGYHAGRIVFNEPLESERTLYARFR